LTVDAHGADVLIKSGINRDPSLDRRLFRTLYESCREEGSSAEQVQAASFHASGA
jgi:hypothetical protein